MALAPEHSRGVLLVGLPNSGKTSFLAALWAVVEDECVDGSLRLHSVEGDIRYLNKIRAQWYECQAPGRNPFGDIQPIKLELTAGDEKVLELRVPDISGETYSELFRTRQWPTRLAGFAEGADGILLLIHPDAASGSVPIDDANHELAGLEPEVEPDAELTETNDDAGRSGEAVRFSHDDVSAEVKMVDLLQSIVFDAGASPRIVAIISAWDLLESRGKTPKQWLTGEMPLLSQFLESLACSREVSICGVSAQGGDYETSASELKNAESGRRPRLVLADGSSSHDITLPLRWLLDGWQ